MFAMNSPTICLPFILLLFLPLSFFLLRFLFAWQPHHRSYRLPPGPPAWPVFGHAFSTRSLYSNLTKLEQQYGPILTLWRGSAPSVLISGPEVAREALIDKGSILASRPRPRSRSIVTNNFQIINTSGYGSYWRNLRRNLVTFVMGSANLAVIKPMRKCMIESLVESLKKQAAENGGVVPVTSSARSTVLRILLFMCVGKLVDDKLVSQVDKTAKATLRLQARLRGDFLPVMRFFEGKEIEVRRAYRHRQEEQFGPFIDDYRERLISGKPVSVSYIHSLLSMQTENGEALTNRDIAALCTEFMNTGTDSTSICIEWAMANLIMHQDVQEKVYSEIQQLVGKKPLEEGDLKKLRYLQAVIKETLRRHPPAHFTFEHSPTEHCKLVGYDMPTNATVSFHLAAMMRDPRVWDEPMEFKPERFLNEEVDTQGWKKSTFIPFGAGRRVCPGEGLGLLHAELIVGRLVQAFKFGPTKDGEVVDMTELQIGGLTGLNVPLYARIEERL